jgi:hypothetical protein
MPALKNNRWERFCLALAAGENAAQAYAQAGFKFHDGNSARLRQHPAVRERLAELQAAAAESTAITVASICKELDEANAVAKAGGQASAMVSASALRAKLAGLLETRIRTEVDVNVHFDNTKSVDEIATKLAGSMVDSYDALTPTDLAQLGQILQKATEKATEFIRSCRARVISPHSVHGSLKPEARLTDTNGL